MVRFAEDDIKELTRVSATLFAGSITSSALIRTIGQSGGFPPNILSALLYAALLFLSASILGMMFQLFGKGTKKPLGILSIAAFLVGAIIALLVIGIAVIEIMPR